MVLTLSYSSKLQRASGVSSLPAAPPQPVQSRTEKFVSKATWIPALKCSLVEKGQLGWSWLKPSY